MYNVYVIFVRYMEHYVMNDIQNKISLEVI